MVVDYRQTSKDQSEEEWAALKSVAGSDESQLREEMLRRHAIDVRDVTYKVLQYECNSVAAWKALESACAEHEKLFGRDENGYPDSGELRSLFSDWGIKTDHSAFKEMIRAVGFDGHGTLISFVPPVYPFVLEWWADNTKVERKKSKGGRPKDTQCWSNTAEFKKEAKSLYQRKVKFSEALGELVAWCKKQGLKKAKGTDVDRENVRKALREQFPNWT